MKLAALPAASVYKDLHRDRKGSCLSGLQRIRTSRMERETDRQTDR